jgi:prepilin-type N-terminal cleavage/methylation domain-containing protein
MTGSARRGFTLLELVVVIAILATLAGLVVSKVDWTRRQADMAASADTCVEIGKNIQLYLTEMGELPNGMDSLLASNADEATPSAMYSKIVASSPDMTAMCAMNTIPKNSTTDGRMGSLMRIGLAQVFDHDESSTDAPNSAVFKRTLNRNADNKFFTVTPGTALWTQIYPVNGYNTETNETNVSLVVLGIGPRCSMIGKTMVNAPQYPHANPTEAYYRYMAVFAAYKDGRRAQFKAVVDAYGRGVPSALSNFYQATPE